MSFDNKDKYKIDALLKEYSEVRSEVRIYEVLQITCIFISVLMFAFLFTIAVVNAQPILIFIAPSISIFFILLSMSMLAYTTSCGLRAAQIENKLKKIFGEPIIEWEYTLGVFNSIAENKLAKNLGKYWVMISSLAVILGVSSVIIGIAYGFNAFYERIGFVAWILIVFYIITTAITIFIGYRLYNRNWEKIKLSL